MHEWLDRLAEELGVPPMTNDEARALLETTRDVAHSVERRFAPLSAYLIGVAVGSRSAESFDAAVAVTRAAIPPPRDPPGGSR